MKKLFLVLCAFSLSLVGASAADNCTFSAETLTIPTVAAGATSNSVAAVIDVRKQDNVALQWNCTSTTFAAGTNLSFNISTSVDGITYHTNRHAVTMTSNILVTNIATPGIGYLRIDSITSTGVIATNTVKYGIKIPQ